MSNLKEKTQRTIDRMNELLDMAIKSFVDLDTLRAYDPNGFESMKTSLAMFDEMVELAKEYAEEFDKQNVALERIEKKLDELKKD